MRKLIVCLVIFLAISILPNISFAQSTVDLQAQIANLLKLVQQLQAQLAQMQGNSGAWCHTFNTDLKIGDQGNEVSYLLNALAKEGLTSNNFSTIYDEKIASYVSAFQEKYVNEILNPAALSHGTGYLGARTRAKMNALYGCKINQSSVIPTNTTLTDIDRVKNILIDIKQGYITGNSSLILQHASVATSKLVTSGTFSSPVSTFTVNNVYQSGSNIVANITVTGGPTDQSPTQNMVFIKEGDNWKFDLGATLNFSVSTPTTSVPVTTTTTQTSNLSITNTSPLSNAKVGIDYAIPLYVSGGPSGVSTNMYSWSIISGSLPPGLILAGSPSGEVIAGAATTAGTYDFTLNVSYGSQYMYKSFTITVIP